MMSRSLKRALLGASILGAALMGAVPADASLVAFKSFTGSVGLSTDGCGSLAQTCTIRANVPAGAKVLGAYLYSSLFSPTITPGGTLNGSAVNYATPLGVNASNGYLQAWRADVTSILAPVINAGPGGTYSFTVTETSYDQDGEALVIVYSHPSLSQQSVGILDGFSSSFGDSSSINFAKPLDPTAAGFTAQMFIGDGFSYDGSDPLNPSDAGQVSTITVNGQTLTTVAGHCDDAQDASCADGNLITVGSFDNVITPFGDMDVTLDHERYNLVPAITKGDTSIALTTVNPSNDDNIFLEAFLVTGLAGFNENPDVPEPLTLSVFGMGLLGLAALRRRRAK